jgi:hypothetical protein
MKLTGENRSTRGKTCPSATLSTKNPTRTGPGSNPGFRGGRPATKRLSHVTTFWEVIVSVIVRKNVHMNMCLILNGYRDRDV